MSNLGRNRSVLPQLDYGKDSERSLRLFQRLENNNNVFPLENWADSFERRPAYLPHQITPGLYLGNMKTAAHYLLGMPQGDCRITHMVSIMRTSGTALRYKLPQPEGEGMLIKRLILDRNDNQTENILRDFDRTSAFIDEAVQLHKTSKGLSGGVLVHCFAGVSRSASLVIAYLLKHPENLPEMVRTMMLDELLDTATFVRSKRPIIFPNAGFRRQLGFYHEVLQCSITDERTGQLKKPYVKWIRNRACNNSSAVVSVILTLEWQRQA